MTARSSRSPRSPAAKTALAAPTASFAWEPRHGLLAAAMACLVARVMIPSESALDDVAGVFFAIAWMLIAGLTALDGWRKNATCWIPMGSELAILALALWYGIAAIVALRTGSPRPAVNAAWLWISYAAAYLALRRLIQQEAERRAVVVVMVSLACAVSLFGLEQFAIEMPATRAAYYANPEASLRQLNIPTDPDARERILFEQRLESSEPFATFALTNSLAGFLTPWLLVGGFIALQAFLQKPDSLWYWLGPLTSCVPIGLCLVLTKSRTAYVAVAFGIALGVLLQPGVRSRLRARWLLAGAGVLGLLVAIGAASGALDREIITEAGKSLGYRTQYWQASLEMVADHPLFGVGPGQYQTIYTQYKAPTASEVVADPHNFLVEVAATSGLPSLILLLALGAFVAMEWTCSKRSPLAEASASSRATIWIIAGGLFGLPLAFPIGLLAYSMPSSAAFLVCIPAMLVALGLWHRWGKDGSLDRNLPLLGAAALLVNLLAAGGIGIPAVSGTLWLLLALSAQPHVPDIALAPRRGAWYPACWAMGTAAAIVAAYFISFRPMVTAQAARQDAAAFPRAAEKHLRAAVEADSWDVTAWRQLAVTRYVRWQAEPTAEIWQAVADALNEELSRSPQSAAAWRNAGEWRLAAYRSLGDPGLLKSAIESFERAVTLYPNSAAYHADLAEAYEFSGQLADAKAQAAKAIKLDDDTPHLDLKLKDRREPMLQILKLDPSKQ